MELIKELDLRFESGKNRRYGLFYCPECKTEVEKQKDPGLRTKTCGCIVDRHGDSRKRIYITWWSMRQRCSSEKHKDYHNYGGRGISVCEEWTRYITFRDWALNNGYCDTLLIDRINNDGNYEPSNCRFVTNEENSHNRRDNKINDEKAREIRRLYGTGKYTQHKLGEMLGLTRGLIQSVVTYRSWENS